MNESIEILIEAYRDHHELMGTHLAGAFTHPTYILMLIVVEQIAQFGRIFFQSEDEHVGTCVYCIGGHQLTFFFIQCFYLVDEPHCVVSEVEQRRACVET